MKKTWRAAIALIAMGAAMMNSAAVGELEYKHAYVDTVRGSLVTVVTDDGNVWGMVADGLIHGEEVLLTMDTMDTTEVEDNTIVGYELY